MAGGKFVIDGLFLTQPVTGIQRYAYEMTRELDKLVEEDSLEIAVPQGADVDAAFDHIRLVRFGKRSGIPWEQIDYANYLRANHALAIGFTNVLPLRCPHGIVTIHDIGYKVNPGFYVSPRDRLSALWHRLNYASAARSEMEIITVSDFSRTELQTYYPVQPERIHVAYPGWQHMDRVTAGDDTFEKYPFLEKGKYCFSMASLMPNKNFRWIVEAAKCFPEKTFAIAGGGKMKDEGLPNVHLLGYVSDADAKTLMANCAAFLFPTFYEGFGMPPLEAAVCGAPEIIVSDTPCMHEVYGDYASYVDPRHPEKWIEVRRKTEDASLLKRAYSWEKSARIVYQELIEQEIRALRQ